MFRKFLSLIFTLVLVVVSLSVVLAAIDRSRGTSPADEEQIEEDELQEVEQDGEEVTSEGTLDQNSSEEDTSSGTTDETTSINLGG